LNDEAKATAAVPPPRKRIVFGAFIFARLMAGRQKVLKQRNPVYPVNPVSPVLALSGAIIKSCPRQTAPQTCPVESNSLFDLAATCGSCYSIFPEA
jgi:hypothetical protein